MVCGWGAVAETAAPAPKTGLTTAHAAATPQTTKALVDSLPQAEVQEIINLLKSNYLNPEALSGPEMERATLQGLITRLTPGTSILQSATAGLTGSSPFHSEILDNRIGYLRPGSLSKQTVGELDAALKKISDNSLNAAVLDLRATPASGDFESAAEIAKRFCPKGAIFFSIKKPTAKQERIFTSNQDPQFQGIMVVLVDQDTAGAPEVLAAVLRSRVKALIIGETTRGQAVEYTDFPLHDGKVLRVAEAIVVVPEVPPIFPDGVKPDLETKLSAEDTNEIMKQSLDKGISQFVFEIERPKMNEAALVAGVNPEIDAMEAAQGKKQDNQPVLRDTVLQRAVDFITTAGFYKTGPASN